MQWQSEDPLAYARNVNAKVVMYPVGQPLSADAELTVPWEPVEAIPGRFDMTDKREDVVKCETKRCPWRCPNPDGDFSRTNHLPPMPPVLEILSQSIMWDPYGHLFGRGAHWPLLVCIGDERHRSKGMQMRREEAAIARWERNSARRGCCAGGEKAGGKSHDQWQRNPWVRGGNWWHQGKGLQNRSTEYASGSRDPWYKGGCAGGEAASGSNDAWTAAAWTNASWQDWQE